MRISADYRHPSCSNAKECSPDVCRSLKHADLFEALYAVVKHAIAGLNGVGELMVYDTALRIGARLSLKTARVFLHAGPRVGARNLGLNARVESLAVDDLPVELRALQPQQIEDVLCIYSDRLKHVARSAAAAGAQAARPME
ncbi:MAG: hypothetical protein ACRD1T_21350 [Acidimicrobiia bacterium]